MEKEIVIELVLDMFGELFIVLDILILPHCLILVIVPHVVEVILDFLLELEIYWAAIVVMLQHSEKFSEGIAIVKILIKILVSAQDVDEVAHQVGEESDTREENEGTGGSFDVTTGGEVSKTNG